MCEYSTPVYAGELDESTPLEQLVAHYCSAPELAQKPSPDATETQLVEMVRAAVANFGRCLAADAKSERGANGPKSRLNPTLVPTLDAIVEIAAAAFKVDVGASTEQAPEQDGEEEAQATAEAEVRRKLNATPEEVHEANRLATKEARNKQIRKLAERIMAEGLKKAAHVKSGTTCREQLLVHQGLLSSPHVLVSLTFTLTLTLPQVPSTASRGSPRSTSPNCSNTTTLATEPTSTWAGSSTRRTTWRRTRTCRRRTFTTPRISPWATRGAPSSTRMVC